MQTKLYSGLFKNGVQYLILLGPSTLHVLITSQFDGIGSNYCQPEIKAHDG